MDSIELLNIVCRSESITRSKVAEELGWSRQRLSVMESQYQNLKVRHIKQILDNHGMTLVVKDASGNDLGFPYIEDIYFDQYCELLETCGMTISVEYLNGKRVASGEDVEYVSGRKQGKWVNTRFATLEKDDGDTRLYRMANGRYFIVRDTEDGDTVIDRIVSAEEAERIIAE